MKFITVIGLMLLQAGCSLLGDNFRNRADDYVNYQQPSALSVPDDLKSEPNWMLVRQDRFPIPEGGVVAEVETGTGDQIKEKAAVPIPQALVVEAISEEAVSFLQYDAQELNPRIDKEGSGSYRLLLDAPFSVSWTAVQDALIQSSFNVADINRSTGLYFLERTSVQEDKKPSFWDRLLLKGLWSRDKEIVVQYQLKLNKSSNLSFLTLLSDSDSLASESETLALFNELIPLLN